MSDSRVDFHGAGIELGLKVGRLKDSGLRLVPLGEVRVVVCASAPYPDRVGGPRRPEKVRDYDCAAQSFLGERPLWQLQSSGKGIPPLSITPRYTVNSIAAMAEVVAKDGGLAQFYSYQVADYLGSGVRKTVLNQFEVSPRTVGFLYPDAPRLPFKVRAFIDFATPRLRRALTEIEEISERSEWGGG